MDGLLEKQSEMALFPDKSSNRITYVDRSVHHHYHEHKNIAIMDDTTKQKIFELKKDKVMDKEKDKLVLDFQNACTNGDFKSNFCIS